MFQYFFRTACTARWLVLSLIFATPLSVAEPLTLDSSEQVNYLNQLKQQHATSNERTALLAEVNSLLTQHALRAGYQVGYSNPQDFLYSVNIAQQGELIIREEIRSSEKNTMEVRSNRINVFGIDPFVSYACPMQGIRCVIFGEDKKTAILTIVRDQDAAKKLARAFSYLIRNIQRG
ncbi:MAG: hypothetical protein RBR45_05440 [Pseudomonas sp.]|jgi:hypothetical protein|nr:hypothetical protein [Pseudomonas sp.]